MPTPKRSTTKTKAKPVAVGALAAKRAGPLHGEGKAKQKAGQTKSRVAKDGGTPYSRAYQRWWEEQGERLANYSTIGGPTPNYYLGNRLRLAFDAGWIAGGWAADDAMKGRGA